MDWFWLDFVGKLFAHIVHQFVSINMRSSKQFQVINNQHGTFCVQSALRNFPTLQEDDSSQDSDAEFEQMLAEAEDMNKAEDEAEQTTGPKNKKKSKIGSRSRRRKRMKAKDEDGYETDHQVRSFAALVSGSMWLSPSVGVGLLLVGGVLALFTREHPHFTIKNLFCAHILCSCFFPTIMWSHF